MSQSFTFSFYHNLSFYEVELRPDLSSSYAGLPNLFEVYLSGRYRGNLRYYDGFCYDYKPEIKPILAYFVATWWDGLAA